MCWRTVAVHDGEGAKTDRRMFSEEFVHLCVFEGAHARELFGTATTRGSGLIREKIVERLSSVLT